MPRTLYYMVPALVASVLLAGVLVSAASAQDSSASDGSVQPSFGGGCTASASIPGYGGIDPAASGGVYTVPKSGVASYIGSVPVEGEDRTTSGKVEIALPLGLPSVSVKSWGSDNTDGNSDVGSVSWDIPSIVPGNVTMTVSGFHSDSGVLCQGRIKIKLDGSGLASTIGLIAVGLTVVSVIGLAWTFLPTGEGD